MENSVKIASRRIIAALRNRQFLSFEELHQACLEELEKINSKIIKDKEKSRWDLFLSEEKAHLLPLGKQPYEYAEWSTAKVQVNSHISFKKHFYSVPYEYLQKEVQVRSTRQTVEIFVTVKESHLETTGLHEDQPAGHQTTALMLPNP